MDQRDHGGGIDAAAARFGGARADWIDLSTGINPQPYPPPALPPDCWTALPDRGATETLTAAARAVWSVPPRAAILPAPGASALIARIPALRPAGPVAIPGPTYNEHAAAFRAAGWTLQDDAPTRVLVHPNNPDGRYWSPDAPHGDMLIIDESFCDVAPDRSLIALSDRPGVVVLKSFGKFWGLAGLRLGFAIGDAALLARLAEMLGPWPVSGPALAIGAAALADADWSAATRTRLAADAARLDRMIGRPAQGTTLFRLYHLPDAAHWQTALARRRIWSRTFPYTRHWLRLGLPGSPAAWARLAAALHDLR